MTTVISDTSPINYLILIGRIELLPALFQKVVMPPAVSRELNHPRTPPGVAAWAASLPAWIEVESPSSTSKVVGLGPGETEAISLALEKHISTVLIDERRGTDAAASLGLAPIGTLNILEAGAAKGLCDFEEAISALLATNFRIGDQVIDEARSRLALKLRPADSGPA